MWRFTIFVVAAAIVLSIGCIGAEWMWSRYHHRYDMPETGFYHGYVDVFFDGFDEKDEQFYWLYFQAESASHWHWRRPTNFSYKNLQVEWREGSVDRRATVSLPALTYRADSVSGPLTRDVVATWLFGSTNRISNSQIVGAVYSYFQAVASGALPPPRHHPYYLEQPVRVRVTHFLLGFGVGSTVYVWLVIWLLGVVFASRKILKNREG